jgi:hypothetical protein
VNQHLIFRDPFAQLPAVDLRRTCPVTVVADIDAADVAPGSIEPRAIDGRVWGYGYACPGCGSRSWLALTDDNPGPRWTVTAGDPAQPATVSLSPSILHAVERGGCGWHGYLTNGVLAPC